MKRKETDNLYQTYGKPLEQSHRGEYLAIFKDERILVMVVGKDDLEVIGVASKAGQKPYHLYRIGQRYVYKFRQLTSTN